MKMPSMLLTALLGAATIVTMSFPSATVFFASAGRGTQSVDLHDPILHMTAYTLSIPSGWNFSSAVIQGSSCVAGAFPVFRVVSPDGLSGMKGLGVVG